MTGMVQSTPTTLNEHQISILFKCAVKDDETLIDAIVERLYGKMKEFDGRRADQTVGLIVDRGATGGSDIAGIFGRSLACAGGSSKRQIKPYTLPQMFLNRPGASAA